MLTDNVSSADNLAGKVQYEKTFDKKKLAYLFGVYLGGGSCSFYTRHYVFSIVSADNDVIERTMRIVNQLLQKSYSITIIKPNKSQLFRFRAWNKNLFLMLKGETNSKSKLPSFLETSDKSTISEFVAGLMDTDGYISKGKSKLGFQKYSLGFTNSGKWLDEFIVLLKYLGVKTGKKTLKRKYRSVNEKDCYQININLRSFIQAGCYFNCRRKQRILDTYILNVRYQLY